MTLQFEALQILNRDDEMWSPTRADDLETPLVRNTLLPGRILHPLDPMVRHKTNVNLESVGEL